MGILWPAVGAGLFIVAFGIGIIVARERLARLLIRAHRAAYGDRTAKIQRLTTPASLIAPGVWGIVMGIIAIAMAIFNPGAF